MYRKSLTIAALLLAGGAHAGSYETSTHATPVPDSASGSLPVRSCPTCAPTLVRLGAQSQFRIGRDLVSFDEFRQFVRNADERYLHVSYDSTTNTVIRLRVDGQIARRAR